MQLSPVISDLSFNCALNPTGRWKIEKYQNRCVLFLEHKHSFLLVPYYRWIEEDYIYFVEKPDIFINGCRNFNHAL